MMKRMGKMGGMKSLVRFSSGGAQCRHAVGWTDARTLAVRSWWQGNAEISGVYCRPVSLAKSDLTQTKAEIVTRKE